MPEHSSPSPQSELSGRSLRRDSIGDSVQRRKYIRRPKPDMHAPKRPLSAYINFSKDQRNEYEHKKWSFSTLAKHIGEDWRDLDLVVKNRYLEEAANDKLNYDQAMRRYKNTAAYSNYKKYVQEFNRRHNSTQITEQSSSPEESSYPSFRDEEAPDGDVGMRDDLELGLSPVQALSDEASKWHNMHMQGGIEFPATAQPPGTINPANLSGATPSPRNLTFGGLQSDRFPMSQSASHQPVPRTNATPVANSALLGSMAFPVEQFRAPPMDLTMLRPAESHTMAPHHVNGPSCYPDGHEPIYNADMMAYSTDSALEDENLQHQSLYGWTNPYMSTAR